MSDLIPFHYDGQQVRVVEIDGEPWLVGRDVAAVLGYTNPRKAVRDHVPAGHRRWNETFPLSDLGIDPQTILISEAGLYRLIMRSHTPAAELFQEWVTAEVLPQIRRTGGYAQAQEIPATYAEALRAAADEHEKRLAAEIQVAELEPKAEYVDRYVSPDDVVTIKSWGTQYGLTDPRARELLVSKNIIYRHSIGSRFSASAGRVVEEFEYRARAGRVTYDWFDLRPQHNAPRHHNGQLRQTLYVRQARAIDLARKVGLHGGGEREVGAA